MTDPCRRYKPADSRHENVVYLRLNDDQYAALQAFARYNDLPVATAARHLLNLGQEARFADESTASAERARV